MKKVIVSITINIIIFVLMVIALFMALFGPDFGNKFTVNSLSIFKYFTTLSNIMMGIVALVFAIKEIIYLKNKKEISKGYYIVKHVATVGVVLTFLTVVLFLAPVFYGKKFFNAFHDANFFYHFLNPVLAFIVFVFFEKTNKLNLKYSLLGAAPFAIYSIYYIIAAVTHMNNGKVASGYDWYGFFYFGIAMFFLLMIMMIALTIGISITLYKLNNLKYKNSN